MAQSYLSAEKILENNKNHSKWQFEEEISGFNRTEGLWQSLYAEWKINEESDTPSRISFTPKDASFLVRKSYLSRFDQIRNHALHNPHTGVLMIGQPGIGKTIFLWYCLIRLIMLKQVILFLDGEEVYLFFRGFVYTGATHAVRSLPVFPNDKGFSRCGFIWTLINVDTSYSGPRSLFTEYPCFPVQASSPNLEHYKRWTKQRTTCLKTALPLWDEEELFEGLPSHTMYKPFRERLDEALSQAANNATHSDSMPELSEYFSSLAPGTSDADTTSIPNVEDAIRHLIRRAIQAYGLAARDVYDALTAPEHARVRHDMAVSGVTYESLKIAMEQFRREQVLPDPTSVSHKIFSIFPSPDNHPNSQVVKFDIDFKSITIAKQVLRRIEELQSDRLNDLYSLMRATPNTSTLAGWCFEPIAFRNLVVTDTVNYKLLRMEKVTSETDGAPKFRIQSSTSDSSSPAIALPNPHLNSYCFREFNKDCLSALQPGHLYVPDTTNHPLFDALWIQQEDGESSTSFTIWLYQISTASSHRGSAEGYVSVRRVMQSLKELHHSNVHVPKKKKDIRFTIRYVYICPLEGQNLEKLEWKMPNGWNESVIRYDHRGEVYAVQFPVTPILGALGTLRVNDKNKDQLTTPM